jgi:Sec-independent protein translocase protein TatA
MLGIWESIAIAVIVIAFILWFGKKAPSTARNAGKCISEFKQGLKELPDAVNEAKKEAKKK